MTVKTVLFRTALVAGLSAAAVAASVLLPSAAAHAPAALGAASQNDAGDEADAGLTRAQACAGGTPRVCRRFLQMDRDGDGVVTAAEARAWRQAMRVTRPPEAVAGLTP
ncbi:MAG: hypothetical protein IT523_02290 [Burkholderiales bacterium]|nr:hypothetical protein [Pseudomonadota bacterium]MCC7067264.1 hypothetical protein [Burkholderiales bacterium]MCZ2135971.1 hypothetical protein [Burkholderiales bacterium]